MSKHLPYPGRYESFSSWDYRCKQRESKRGYGYQNAMRVRDFAEKNGLLFKKYDGNGKTGMCNRTDGIAYKVIDGQNNQ